MQDCAPSSDVAYRLTKSLHQDVPLQLVMLCEAASQYTVFFRK
jgi:hypothetical protein